MNARYVVRWLAAAVAMFCGLARPAFAEATQPNILLIVADDLSEKLCTWLPQGEGRSLMPTMDRLAREGVILENMHSPSPVCTPSRYCILTGNYASRSRSHAFLRDLERDGQSVVQFNTHIIPGEETLPLRMKRAGYVTGAVGKNHVIEVDGHRKIPYKTSLDAPGLQEKLDRNYELLQQAFRASGFDYAERLYHGNPDADGIKPLAAHNQEWITEGALTFIEENADRPFFLYMATTLPHGPFEPERSWRNPESVTPLGILDAIPDVQAPRATIDERLKEAGVSGWNTGAVLWLDDGLAAIMKKLEELGIDDNTIVVFLSDHGTEAKGGAYMGGTHTAALVWKKGGFPVGARIPAELALIDLAPTLLELAGAGRHDDTFDGRSFAPILRGESEAIHDALYFEMGYSRAVLKDDWKYIALRYPEWAETMSMEERRQRLDENNEILAARGRPIPTTDPATPFSHLFLIPGGHDVDQVAVKGFPGFFDRDQLYDLETDPGEQVNLAGREEFQAKLNDMKALLTRFVSALPGRFGEFGKED